MAKAISQITITDLNDPIISGTAPSNPKEGTLWLNTSVTPNELLSWESGSWKTIRSVPKPDSVGTDELKTGAVTDTKVADNAITSTKITGSAITTPKLATNAVTAEKIAAGAITTEKLQAGSITADKLSVLAKSLINNYTQTGSTEGWSPVPLLSRAPELGNTHFHLMRNTANVQVLSNTFEVDPTCTYKVTLSVRVPSTVGYRYFGMYCYDRDNTLIAVTPINVLTKNEETATTNPYFWSQSGSIPNWRDMEAYILGCNVSAYSIPETKNVSRCFRLPRNAHHCRIRYLNYPNNAAETDAYWWSPSVVQADAGEIQGERIRTGKITALNNASWLNLNDGKFSFGNGAFAWDGSILLMLGELKSINGTRTAYINNGQYMILNNNSEIFNLTNFVGDGKDIYLVLGNYARRLVFARSTTPGSISKEYGALEVSPEKLVMYVPGVFNFLNITDGVNGYKIGGQTALNIQSNGTYLSVQNGLYTYIRGSRYGGFSAAYDNYLTLGRSDYRWMSLWVVSGVVQTSGRKDKEKIYKLRKREKLAERDPKTGKEVYEERPKDTCFEDDVFELLDEIADRLCTFRYKEQEGEEAWQLGVVADEIEHLPAYPFIGIRQVIPAKEAVKAEPEVPEVRGEKGEIITAYRPAIEAQEAVPEQVVHGLNPLPVAMLAISGYKKLREQIKDIEARLEVLEKKAKRTIG